MFYYGNYDGKSSSPSFNVLFDGKHRGTVSISSASEPYTLELIFVPASGDTSVCFVRTSSSSNPFVSSIEVVDLAPGMYEELGTGEGFFYQARVAYGTTGLLRSDLYGRFRLSSGPTVLATSIDTSGASNKPPETVLQNSWSSETLVLADPTLPSSGVPVYLAMYFSEPIDTSGLTSFDIFYGGKRVTKSPVVPMFGETIQVVVKDVVASSTTQLEFRSTASSIFPPLINALELYVISDGTSGGPGGSSGGPAGSGGGGGGSSGSGGGGSGGTGGSNGASSGGPTNEAKKSKLPIIGGAISVSAFVLIAYVFIAIIVTKRRRARLQALSVHTVANMGTGTSHLFEQHMNYDRNEPVNEIGIGEIDDQNGMSQAYSYVTQ